MLRVANSTPIVDLDSRLNSFRVKRDSKFDFPTPESPMRTTVAAGNQTAHRRARKSSSGQVLSRACAHNATEGQSGPRGWIAKPLNLLVAQSARSRAQAVPLASELIGVWPAATSTQHAALPRAHELASRGANLSDTVTSHSVNSKQSRRQAIAACRVWALGEKGQSPLKR